MEKKPLMGSADGNKKLLRFKSSGVVKKKKNLILKYGFRIFDLNFHEINPYLLTDRTTLKTRYGDEAFISDQTAQEHRDLINSHMSGVISLFIYIIMSSSHDSKRFPI